MKLQELIENLLKLKNITEAFKILIYLLRKYLPRDFKFNIDKGNYLYKIRKFVVFENNELFDKNFN